MTKTTIKPSVYLYDFVKKKVDLPEFLETEIGCKLTWLKSKSRAKTECPMPSHNERKPSFHMTFFEDTETWVYHCFGCGAKGTIINFCQEYYGLSNAAEALIFICEKFGFKQDKELATSCLKDIKKKVDFHKKVEYTHIVVASQCRRLLRKDYDKHSKWIAQAYRKMNKALDKEDIKIIEGIGSEVFQRMEN